MYTMNLGRGSKRKGVGESSGKKLYSMNLGRGSKRKGRGRVVQNGYPAPTLVEKEKNDKLSMHICNELIFLFWGTRL